MIEYLGEIKTEFENTLACLSGAQMGSNHEKNWRLKISWHTPFIHLSHCYGWLTCCNLKGQFHENFGLYLHDSNPPGPLINRLKWFCWIGWQNCQHKSKPEQNKTKQASQNISYTYVYNKKSRPEHFYTLKTKRASQNIIYTFTTKRANRTLVTPWQQKEQTRTLCCTFVQCRWVRNLVRLYL